MKEPKQKGRYYVVFKIEEIIVGYIENEVHNDFASAKRVRDERARVTGIEGEINGGYDVLYHEGIIEELIGKKS